MSDQDISDLIEAPPAQAPVQAGQPAGTSIAASVTDTSPELPPERQTPRFKAADEAMARSAHLIATLPYRSAAYQAAVAADKHIEDEYNAAKAEALAAPVAAAPQTQNIDDISVTLPKEQQGSHTFGDLLGLDARGIAHGVAAIPDTMAAIGGALPNAISHMMGDNRPDPTAGLTTRTLDADLDRLGAPRPVTDTERLNDALISGGTSGLLTAGAGGPAALAGTLSGAGSSGASELARQSGAGPIPTALAGLAGGIAGPTALAGAGRVADAFAPLAEREMSPTMQAFDRQQVPALPADVGGTGTQMATAAAKTTLGGIPIHQAAQASITAARVARARIAAGIGNAGNELTAGQAAQKGANAFVDSTAAKGGRLYDAIPIAAEAPAALSNTKAALADLTAGLKSNPELSSVIQDPRMQRIAAAIQGRVENQPTGLLDAQGNAVTRPVQVGGQLSWQDLKDFRTYIGEKAGAPALQADTRATDLKALYGALSRDMEATAQAQGPKALAAFTRANSFWRARAARIDSVIAPILGKDSGNTAEQSFRAIESWAGNKGSFVKTAQALRSLPEDEANAVRATIFDRLGNASAGQQTAAGDAFSPSTFLTQWNKIPDRTRSVLFPGPQYQQDIKDLVTIADAQKAAGRYANTSQTATALHMANVGAHALHFWVDPLGTLASLGGQLGVGKMLASPSFARWLASAPKKPNAAAQLAHVNRLTAIAVKQPAIANDILGLQERLATAFAHPGQPLAAQPEDQEQGQ